MKAKFDNNQHPHEYPHSANYVRQHVGIYISSKEDIVRYITIDNGSIMRITLYLNNLKLEIANLDEYAKFRKVNEILNITLEG